MALTLRLNPPSHRCMPTGHDTMGTTDFFLGEHYAGFYLATSTLKIANMLLPFEVPMQRGPMPYDSFIAPKITHYFPNHIYV